MINLKTYTSADEYEQVKGINLQEELTGSTDHDDKAPTLVIFRVERALINFWKNNYDFTEDMITSSEKALENFKLGVIDQVEDFMEKGLKELTQIDEYQREHPGYMCQGTIGYCRGFMNLRSY